MRLTRLTVILSAVTVLLLAELGLGCTTFCFEHQGDWIVGKNLDWMIEDGMVTVNKRGVAKRSFVSDNPAEWVSTYGSVTVNQYGRELPMGGMNEAGLVVENMWLDGAEYPAPDHRAALSVLQWVQYQLDTADLVEDVMASDSIIRIQAGSQPLHFLVCDGEGGCASIEFLAGRMVVHSGESMPHTALTNNTYEQSRAFVAAVGGDETSEAFSEADYSLKRFYWAAEGVAGYVADPTDDPIDYAFDILDKASVDRTQWRVVYDASERRIAFQTRSTPSIRHLDFEAFDFSCATSVRILDMSLTVSGDAGTAFTDYTFEANYDLIRGAFGGTPFLKDTPEEQLLWLARYPESLQCTE